MHLKYRADVDGLRALAIFTVVWFHASPREIPGGFTGVDIFFVISGYLISGIILRELRNGEFTVRNFYARRFRRILPALATVLLASWAVAWIALFSWEYAEFGKQMAASSAFSANILFWSESGYFDAASEMKPLLHLWSLGVEEQFYLFWPLILLFFFRRSLNLAATIGVLIALSFVLNIVLTTHAPSAAFYLLPARFWELLLGGSLAYMEIFRPGIFREWGEKLPARIAPHFENIRSLAGFGLIVLGALALNKSKPFPGWWALAPTLGCWLLISTPGAWFNRRVLSSWPFVHLGLISYPLYLWHWPLISMTYILQEGQPSHHVRNQAVLVAVALSIITYKFIEPYFRKPRAGSALSRTAPALTAGLGVLAMLCVIGGWTLYGGGFPARYASLEQARTSALATTGLKTFGGDAPTMKDQLWSPNTGLNCPDAPGESKIDIRLCPGTGPIYALVGDSHADHYLAGLLEFPDSPFKHLLFAPISETGGCPPLLGVRSYKPRSNKDPDECLNFHKQLLHDVAEDKSVDTVLLASRGPVYVDGTGFGIEYNDWVIEDAENPSIKLRDGFMLGYSRTIELFLKAGKHVVFIIDVPELGFEAPNCILHRPFVLGPRPVSFETCANPRPLIDQRNRNYFAVIEELKKKYPQVTFFDPMPLMCDDKFCYGKKDGELLYRDDDHLSRNGSHYIVQGLARALLPDTTKK